MRKILLWSTTLFVLVAVNYLIVQKEGTLANGRTMLLHLAPVDPRSLIQGDYMELRYAIGEAIPKALLSKNKGNIVVVLDSNNVARFVRVHRGEKLGDGEYLLFYRNRGELRLGAESFMFQEGDAGLYSKAKYGELKVDASGASVLVGLRGEDFKPLGRKQLPQK
jgi:uncharacterized membrane-anchored protein